MELAQDIMRLANMAYPSAPHDVRETLAKEEFIDSLVSSDMSLLIKQALLNSLNDAVRHAAELEAFNRAESKLAECQGYSHVISGDGQKKDDSCKKDIKNLQKTMSDLCREFKSWKELQSFKSQRANNFR